MSILERSSASCRSVAPTAYPTAIASSSFRSFFSAAAVGITATLAGEWAAVWAFLERSC